ncbi:hypothetical protein CDAR_94531 [Caerostris darwini]|uniref:Uncharacterized protein n=1 Tax=Caerostris darwini TaxID=1538125 RepID=A0AAV4NG05_9ARAC|nr:hypothetical protein CDAR_94531 [Caerostris darwini]
MGSVSPEIPLLGPMKRVKTLQMVPEAETRDPETHFSVRKEDLHKRNEEKASAGDNERVFFQEKSAANGEEREREVSLFNGSS